MSRTAAARQTAFDRNSSVQQTAFKRNSAVRTDGLQPGRCSFDRDKQLDTCEIRNIHADGSILAGVLTIKYTLDPKSSDAKSATKSDAKAGQNPDGKKIAKIVVTPKMITDSPVDNAPYDAFPVRCPDDTVWTILNETIPPK